MFSVFQQLFIAFQHGNHKWGLQPWFFLIFFLSAIWEWAFAAFTFRLFFFFKPGLVYLSWMHLHFLFWDLPWFFKLLIWVVPVVCYYFLLTSGLVFCIRKIISWDYILIWNLDFMCFLWDVNDMVCSEGLLCLSGGRSGE